MVICSCKEDTLNNWHSKICGSFCFQKELMGWKRWRYNLIFKELETGMRFTEIHTCFSMSTSKHDHFIRMKVDIIFLTEFPSLSSLQASIQNILQSGSEITLSFPSCLFVCDWAPRLVHVGQQDNQGTQFGVLNFLNQDLSKRCTITHLI